MYGSPVSKDLNLPSQPPMTSSGLLRYRSAPSSVLGDLCDDLLPPAPGAATGPPRDAGGTDNVFSRFLADHHHHIRDDKPSQPPPPPQAAHFPSAADMASQHQHQQMMFHSQSQSQSQSQQQQSGGLYRTSSGMGAAAGTGTGAGIGVSAPTPSNLIRQSSSPAGFLDHFGMDNGYGAMLRASMGMGFRDGSGGGGGAATATDGGGGSGGRLKGQLSFSSRHGGRGRSCPRSRRWTARTSEGAAPRPPAEAATSRGTRPGGTTRRRRSCPTACPAG